MAYNAIHANFGMVEKGKHIAASTVEAAIITYLKSADHLQLGESSRGDERRILDKFRNLFGTLHVADLDLSWWSKLRDKYSKNEDPIGWNQLRAKMRRVFQRFRIDHSGIMPTNPLFEIKPLRVPDSDANRAWPLPVFEAVLRAATPEFRALLVLYVMTAQRGSDVTKMSPQQYDTESRTITLRQKKTGKDLVLRVPDALASTLADMQGRHAVHLLLTPRGKPWNIKNAQETLRTLLSNLGLDRYTLDGLRATGPTELRLAGETKEDLQILLRHFSITTTEGYLKGAADFPAIARMQEALAVILTPTLESALVGATQTRAAEAVGCGGRKKTPL
jgi:integrase